jgi:hypothetical protein
MTGRMLACAAVALLAMAVPTAAQEKKSIDRPGDAARPAPSNVGNAPYPRIDADLSITFHLKAGEVAPPNCGVAQCPRRGTQAGRALVAQQCVADFGQDRMIKSQQK